MAKSKKKSPKKGKKEKKKKGDKKDKKGKRKNKDRILDMDEADSGEESEDDLFLGDAGKPVYQGSIVYQAGWFGFGKDMPIVHIDNLSRKVD